MPANVKIYFQNTLLHDEIKKQQSFYPLPPVAYAHWDEATACAFRFHRPLHLWKEKFDSRQSNVGRELETWAAVSRRGRKCVLNKGFTITEVLFDVHELGLGYFPVSIRWD